MSVEVILLALSPVFLLFVVVEFFLFKKYYDVKDSLANTVLALLHQGADALALVVLMPFFYWLYQYRLFDIELSALTIFAAFVLQDFLYYWFHRASHHVHWLWAAHVVHHSSQKMNFTTAFRQSLMYPVAGMWLFWMPMLLVGFSPVVVVIVVALNLAYQFFVHTQAVNKLGFLEHIFNTPSNHRVHHAINSGYLDKNFGGVLMIWDKLFGTYTPEQNHAPCKFGIVGQIHSNNPLVITFHQWRHLLVSLIHAKDSRTRLKVLLGYPTSSNQDRIVDESKNDPLVPIAKR